MEFKDYFVIAILAGLFIFTLVTSISNLQSQNDAPNNINNDPFLNKLSTNMSGELTGLQKDTETQRSQLETEEKHPIITSLGFAFTAILDTGNLFMGSVVTIFQSFFFFLQEAFSINGLVTATIIGVIIGLLILAVWSLIRAGR